MNPLKRYTVIGIIFVMIAGTLSHFLYDWLGQPSIVGLVTPVNESVWEHMKLLFFPMLLYSFVMTAKLKGRYPCVRSALCVGLLSGTFLIPVLYYAYTALLLRDVFVLDIAIFLLGIITAFLLAYRLALSCRQKSYGVFWCVLVCLLFFCFLLFSYHPLDFAIFQDPTKYTNPA